MSFLLNEFAAVSDRLMRLDLSRNKIGNIGAAEVAKLVARSVCLRELKMNVSLLKCRNSFSGGGGSFDDLTWRRIIQFREMAQRASPTRLNKTDLC